MPSGPRGGTFEQHRKVLIRAFEQAHRSMAVPSCERLRYLDYASTLHRAAAPRGPALACQDSDKVMPQSLPTTAAACVRSEVSCAEAEPPLTSAVYKASACCESVSMSTESWPVT